jgi:hypothetical protein
MFLTYVVEKIKTLFKFGNFFRKLSHLRDNVINYSRARQAADDNIIRLTHFACWITKATDTHSEYVILIDFSV